MSITRTAAYSLVPLLSRLVLAAAFVPAGWDKIIGEEQVFEGQAAQILQRLGVGETVSDTATAQAGIEGTVLASAMQEVETGSLIQSRRPRPGDPQGGDVIEVPVVIQAPPPEPVVVVSQPQPEPVPPEALTPTLSQRERGPEIVNPRPPVLTDEPREVIEAGDAAPVKAKRLHNVTVMLVTAGRWPEGLKPDWMAWAAAGTELVGGALILIGIFSRIWGLGLAVTMGFAFYMTSLGSVTEYGLFALPMPEFNRAFTQIGLFVMALGVTLTGAGAFSLDRMLFRGGGDGDEEEEHLLHLG